MRFEIKFIILYVFQFEKTEQPFDGTKSPEQHDESFGLWQA